LRIARRSSTAIYYKFKPLGIDKCPYKIPITEWTDDSVAPKDGVDSMTIEVISK